MPKTDKTESYIYPLYRMKEGGEKQKMKCDKKMAIMVTAILVISIFALVMPVSAHEKYLWEQVNDEGFGDLTNDYAWSMHEYKGYLYVGTLNTNFSDPPSPVNDGLEIYRSPNGSYNSWEQIVGPTGTQLPAAGFGTFCIGARGMEVYENLLWVGTSNPFIGCQIWVTNGTHWKLANIPGFNNSNNIATRGITVFKGQIYAEAQSPKEGAGVWKYTGPTDFDSIGTLLNRSKWVQVNTPGFGEPETNTGIGELIPFNPSTDGEDIEYLYAGTWNGTGPQFIQAILTLDLGSLVGCQVWRTNGTVNVSDPPRLIWEKVMDGGFGDPQNGAILSSAVFDGSLYMGTQNFADQAELWRTSDGTTWEPVTETGFLDILNFDFSGFGNGYIWRMIVYNNSLFVGTLNPILGCQVWKSSIGDPGTFEQVNVNGMNNERKIPIADLDGFPIAGIDQYGVRSFAEFKGSLYLGTASFGDWIDKIIEQGSGESSNYSEYVGCEVWRTNGTTYTQPEIEVAKTVWDPTVGEWVDRRNAGINDTVSFRTTIHIVGTYNLTKVTVVDFLSSSLNYSDNATLQYPNGTISAKEPFNMTFEEEYKGCPFSGTILLWYLDGVEPCNTFTIEYNATVVEEGLDVNFLYTGGHCEDTNECGYGWDYVLIFSGPLSGDAADSIGSVQEVYQAGETVYAIGSGFDNDSWVDVYIVDDYSWLGFEVLSNFNVYANKTVPTDAAGNIEPVEIWPNSVPGRYDMVFDADRNGLFSPGIDVVDHPAHPGFTVWARVPTLTPIGIVALVGLLTIIATSVILRRKKR
jgi:uncharacterized repeat protein (TIGR01451 family)